MDERRHRKVKRFITVLTILVLIPSIYLATDVVQEAAFNTQSIKFVKDLRSSEMFQNTQIIDADREYHHRSQCVTLSLIGKPISNEQIAKLQDMLHTQYGLKKTSLVIKQTGETIDITKQNEIIEDILNKKDATIAKQDSTISELRSKINAIQDAETLSQQLTEEIYAQYPAVQEFAVTDMVQYNTRSIESKTVAVVYLQWDNNSRHQADEQKLVKWLKVRMNVDELKVIH